MKSSVPTTINLLQLATEAREAGEWRAAAALYARQLAATPDDADTLCWHGHCLWNAGELEGAVASYAKASALEPGWSGTHNCLGTLNRELGRTHLALAEYRKAIALAPDFGEAHANLADLLWTLGKLEEAAEHFRHAIEADPEAAWIYEDLARVLNEQDLLAEASMAIREAIRLEPHRTSARGLLATIYSKRDMHDEAEETMVAAIKETPRDASLWSRLSWMRWRAKRYDEAKQAAEEAITLDRPLPYPHFVLGSIAEQNNDRDAAIAHYRDYLKHDPDDNEGAVMALAHLGAEKAPEKAPEAYMKQLYAKRSTFWDGEVDNRTQYAAPMRIAEALERFMGGRTGIDIMDAGCGTGLCGPLLRARAKRLDGLDLSAHMLEKAREKGAYDELIEGDLESVLRARPAQYDAISSAATLIHFGDLAGPLGASAVALRPGGWMAFTVFPHRGEGVGVLKTYCHSHSDEHIRDRAAGAGFEVAAIEEIVHEYNDGKPIAGLVVVLRRHSAPA